MKRILAVIFVMLVLTTVGCSDDKRPAEAEKKTNAIAKGPQNKASSPSLGNPTQTNKGEKIFLTVTPLEAKRLMETRKDLMVVDLREPNELSEGYIEGSQLIPMSALAKGTKTLPADKPLLLICAVGGRSYGVGRYFSVKGYPEIYNLQGGISSWKRAGLPLER